MLLNCSVGEDSWECLRLPGDPGNQAWILIGRTNAEAETSIVWPRDGKNWLTGKDSNAGEDWRQENGMTENEMVEWPHQHDGQKFE